MKSHIKPVFFRHGIIKWLILLVFFGAGVILLWPGSSLFKTNIFIPVDLGNLPDGLIITTPPVMGLEVYVSGPKSVIETLPDLKIRYALDLSGAEVGVKSIPVYKERILFPRNVSIISINPSHLTLKVENEVKKKVPFIVAFSGKPAAGFFISGTVTKPSSVILKGSETVLGPIEKTYTKPIDVNGLSESFKKEIAIDLAEGLDIVSPSGIIIAEIFIEEKIVTKKYQDIPVKGKDTPHAYEITPNFIDIEVRGPVNTLEKLYTDKAINVYVDLKALKPGVYVRRAVITLPVNTALVDVKPKIFTVKILASFKNTKK